MPFTRANGIEICYEDTGPSGAPTVLLVNGFRSQLISWDEGFVELLRGHGFRVVRFDNRDVGLTSKTQGATPPLTRGEDGTIAVEGEPPYTLADMASDGMAVLDAVGVERAHVVGASMGGMIVQRMALGHPGRVLSMTSIMSTTGNPKVGRPTPEAMTALLTPPPPDREGYIAHTERTWSVFAGPHHDPERSRKKAAAAYDRSFHPPGGAYQLAAIMSDGDRTALLREVRCPSAVVHGRADPLVTLSGGEATAAAIPDAELVVLDEMGHDVLPRFHAEITYAIAKNAARA